MHNRAKTLVLAAIAALVLFGISWRRCSHSSAFALLQSSSGYDWIVHPASPDVRTHHAFPAVTVFRRRILLASVPTEGTLSIRAFRTAAASINGRPVSFQQPSNWKEPSEATITSSLQAGTNEITVWVTNSIGPPALWLRLCADKTVVGSDNDWEVLGVGNVWRTARRVSDPPDVPSWNALSGGESLSGSIRHIWPLLLVFGIVSALLLAVCDSQFGQRLIHSRNRPANGTLILLCLVLAARAALFLNNIAWLPRGMGFDAKAHEDYVQFIREKHALPLPKDGWEMHQPPLYYAVSAGVLGAGGLQISDEKAGWCLRAINGAVGLIHCVLALLCFRKLFPENREACHVALLIAALVPPHLYLSQYVTNEPLSGLLVTVAFYLFLCALRNKESETILCLGCGVALGAALLTKLTALLALPVFIGALGLQLVQQGSRDPGKWLRTVGVLTFACLAVSAWHYGRVWSHIGKLPLPNWEDDPSTAWRQEPGFRTIAYYLRFGHVFVSPLFSGLHGFGDGIYATLWGDGLASGTASLASRPPWNYNLMNAAYLLAIVPTILFLIGLVAALVHFTRRPSPEWLLVIGLVAAFSAAVIYMTLRAPWLADVKAFFAFPALVPFSALVAAGWTWAGRRSRGLRLLLGTALGMWTATTLTAFWIRTGNPETHRIRGIYQTEEARYSEAGESLASALKLDPADAQTHFDLAILSSRQNQTRDAIHSYREALKLRPDFPEALNNLAWLLATHDDAGFRNGPEAVQLATHACELTQYEVTLYIGTLAAALAEAHRFDEAVTVAGQARDSALACGEPDVAATNARLLELYRSGSAYRDPATTAGESGTPRP